MAASYHDEKSSQRVKQHRNCGAVSLLLLLTRILRLWIESQYRVCANVLVLLERAFSVAVPGPDVGSKYLFASLPGAVLP